MGWTSFHAWECRPPSDRALADAWLTEKITAIHAASRGTYGAPRVHAELALGEGVRVGRKRVERLMAAAGLEGIPVPRMLEETYLTVAEIADLFKLNQQTVRNWIDDRPAPRAAPRRPPRPRPRIRPRTLHRPHHHARRTPRHPRRAPTATHRASPTPSRRPARHRYAVPAGGDPACPRQRPDRDHIIATLRGFAAAATALADALANENSAY